MLGAEGAVDITAEPPAMVAGASHTELSIGPYGHTLAAAPVTGLAPADLAPGVDLQMRWVSASIDGDQRAAIGSRDRVRLFRDPAGPIRVDRIEATGVLAQLRVRPDLGDAFELSLGLARAEYAWTLGDAARAAWRVYSPIALLPIGLSNPADDTERRLHYAMQASGGLGGDVLARVVGPVGVHLRAEAEAGSRRRFSAWSPVRHEVELLAEAGLAIVSTHQVWLVDGWLEHLTLWEPRDTAGRDGVDRQYVAGGVRVSGRFYRGDRLVVGGGGDDLPPLPPLPPPTATPGELPIEPPAPATPNEPARTTEPAATEPAEPAPSGSEPGPSSAEPDPTEKPPPAEPPPPAQPDPGIGPEP